VVAGRRPGQPTGDEEAEGGPEGELLIAGGRGRRRDPGQNGSCPASLPCSTNGRGEAWGGAGGSDLGRGKKMGENEGEREVGVGAWEGLWSQLQ
jgi:hypothetical protein